MQKSHVSCASRHSVGIDIDMDELGSSLKEIRVVTVVNQEVEMSPEEGVRGDQESTRDLINKDSFCD